MSKERVELGSTRLSLVALTLSAGVLTVDALQSDFFACTLTENATLAAPLNPAPGRRFLLRLRQDGTGSRTLAFDAIFRFPGGTMPIVTSTADHTDYLSFAWHETDLRWDYIGNCFNYAP